MKLKTRIIVGFIMIILVPLLLFAATLYGFSQSQARRYDANESAGNMEYDIAIMESENSQVRVQLMTKDLFFSAFIILIFTSLAVGYSHPASPARCYPRSHSSYCRDIYSLSPSPPGSWSEDDLRRTQEL